MVTFVHPIQFFVWIIIIDFVNAYHPADCDRLLLYLPLKDVFEAMGCTLPLHRLF